MSVTIAIGYIKQIMSISCNLLLVKKLQVLTCIDFINNNSSFKQYNNEWLTSPVGDIVTHCGYNGGAQSKMAKDNKQCNKFAYRQLFFQQNVLDKLKILRIS